MATYKVPQNVEAEDKLIGPLSFRQFIYALIAVGAAFLAWALSRIFIGLLIVPLPIVVLFGILALPIKKDQPMEIYLLAIIRFWTKPRRRIWDPEGVVSLVTITAPNTSDDNRINDINYRQASQRMAYLAQVVDTGGWASRGVSGAPGSSNMNDTYAAEAANTPDVLDDSTGIGKTFDTMISQQDSKRRQDLIDRMRLPPAQTTPTTDGYQPSYATNDDSQSQFYTAGVADNSTVSTADNQNPSIEELTEAAASAALRHATPYPSSIRQKVIMPMRESLDEQPIRNRTVNQQDISYQTRDENKDKMAANVAVTASQQAVSPDIINLAHNNDLSVEALARQARRIQKTNLGDDEIEIKLR